MNNPTLHVNETRQRLREAMPAAQRWAYFDHAAMSPLPRPTADALQNWLAEAVNVGNPVWLEWVKGVESMRSDAARMIGARAEDAAGAGEDRDPDVGVLGEVVPDPIELLARTGCLGERTTVVHATHADGAELDLLASQRFDVVVFLLTTGDVLDEARSFLAVLERAESDRRRLCRCDVQHPLSPKFG